MILNIFENKTWSSVSNSTSVLPFFSYPLSLRLVPYPLVLFLSQNLGGGYCHSCHCCDCPQQKYSQLLVQSVRLEFDNIIIFKPRQKRNFEL